MIRNVKILYRTQRFEFQLASLYLYLSICLSVSLSFLNFYDFMFDLHYTFSIFLLSRSFSYISKCWVRECVYLSMKISFFFHSFENILLMHVHISIYMCILLLMLHENEDILWLIYRLNQTHWLTCGLWK